jgi:heme-degrading monooxygenase HmoA
MFAVVFEVHPRPDRWEEYLGYAKLLRPDLVQVDGFLDNVRYRSQRRPGWLLSLSTWRDEKALVRWRTFALHHEVQGKGRSGVFQDYRLRVGQVTADNQLPPGQALRDQRLDETEAGDAKTLSLIEMTRPSELHENSTVAEVAVHLGLPAQTEGLVGWDVFEAILTPGELLLLLAWRDDAAAEVGERDAPVPPAARRRRVRVVRDYGMFARHEAPQYFPGAPQDPAPGANLPAQG